MEKTSTDLNTQYQDDNSKLSTELSFDIITDPNSLCSLSEEWAALYDKADKPYFTQSFEWNWHCWQTVSEPQGEKLYCLIIRRTGQAVLIWPLVISRNYRFWSVARSLALVSTEYSDVLVDATQDSKALTELALQQIIKTCPCDLIQLPDTRADSLLYSVVGNAKGMMLLSTTAAPYIAWEKYTNWETYYQQLSKSMRHNLSRRFRRLAELGDLRFDMLSGNDAYQEELKWLIQTKQNWVTARNLAWSPFTSNYIDLLTSIIGHGGEHGRVQICILKIDNKPIVGQLMRIDRARVEFVINAYDPEYSTYSPTQIMTEHCIKWAFERHLTIDYRLGDADHKRDWAEEKCEVVSYEICCNFFGKINVLIRTAHNNARILKASILERCKNILNSRKESSKQE